MHLRGVVAGIRPIARAKCIVMRHIVHGHRSRIVVGGTQAKNSSEATTLNKFKKFTVIGECRTDSTVIALADEIEQLTYKLRRIGNTDRVFDAHRIMQLAADISFMTETVSEEGPLQPQQIEPASEKMVTVELYDWDGFSLLLPENLSVQFVENFRFHLDENRVIFVGWLPAEEDRNYIVESVHYNKEKGSIRAQVSPQAIFLYWEARRVADEKKRRLESENFALVKSMLATQSINFELASVAGIVDNWGAKFSQEGLNELNAYISRLPSRFAKEVAAIVLDGVDFPVAVEKASANFAEKVNKKAIALYKSPKNRARTGDASK
jgi:hypothetical protein